jgi:hypothetical protein
MHLERLWKNMLNVRVADNVNRFEPGTIRLLHELTHDPVLECIVSCYGAVGPPVCRQTCKPIYETKRH